MNYKFMNEEHAAAVVDSRRLFGDHYVYLVSEEKKDFLIAVVTIDKMHEWKPEQHLYYRTLAPHAPKMGPASEHQGGAYLPGDDELLRALPWVSCQSGQPLTKRDMSHSGIFDTIELQVLQNPSAFRGDSFLLKLAQAKAIADKLRHLGGDGRLRDSKHRIIDPRTGKPRGKREIEAERNAVRKKLAAGDGFTEA
jgi:hypothetical protein